MLTPEEREKFHELAAIKLKPGESLCTSYFERNGTKPKHIITSKIDGTFILYEVTGKTLKKIEAANSVAPLDKIAGARIK